MEASAMSNEKPIDRSDAFRMEMSGIHVVTHEEAMALILAREAEDVERRARRAKRMADEEASKAKKASGPRRSRPVAESARSNEKTLGAP